MYLLEFDKNLSNFEWTKLPISCPPRAYHSAAFIPKLGAVALIGGIICDKDGRCSRQNLNVILINIRDWSWTEHKLSDDIFLSSTKVVLVQATTLLYFGGYTSKNTSPKQEENEESHFWGTVTFHQRDCHSPLKISWQGKANKVGPFACGDAVKVGNEILVACGTKRKWAVCTEITPQAQPCDLPQCTAPADENKWIR